MQTPNLFIPGFAKSGTSSLHAILIKHANIKEGIGKEPHTYLNDKKYKLRFDEAFPYSFHHLYSNIVEQDKYFIDSSTVYSVSPFALKRILKDVPEAKFIIIARDPFDRIKSHYRWMVSLGFVEKPFEEEIKNWDKRVFSPTVNYWGNFKNYIYFSKYGQHFSNMIEIIPEGQRLFLKYERFIQDTQGVVDEICRFLELPMMEAQLPNTNRTKPIVKPKPRSVQQKIRYHVGRTYRRYVKGIPQSEDITNPLTEVPKIKDEQLDFLVEYLAEDLKLYKSLGFDFEYWKQAQRLLG